MLLRDVGQVRQHLAQSAVLADPIWDRDADTVTSFEVTMFRARMSAHGLAKEGDEAVDLLQGEAIKELARGRLHNAPFVRHVLAEPRFMVDELLEGLRKLPKVRRQACLYALEENERPEVVVSLTWKQVLQSTPRRQMTIHLIRERNACRHIRLGYVFWEFATNTIAAPLLGLQGSIEAAFGRRWPELALAYQSMIWVDGQAEGYAFVQSFRDAQGG